MVGVLVLIAPHETHAQITEVNAGMHAGSFTRQGEGRDGTTGAYGGWIGIGVEQFRLEIDVVRSTTLQQRGSGCTDPLCMRSAPGTSLERNWAFAVAGLWQRRTTVPVAPHVLVGIGRLARTTSYNFDDPAIADHGPWRGGGGMLVAGAGLDFPTQSRFFGRVEYRFNLRTVEDMIHEFRVGGGVRF